MRKEHIQPWLPVVSNELITRYFPVVFTHSKGNELFLGVRRNGCFNRVLQAVTMVGCWWDHRLSIRLHFRIRVIIIIIGVIIGRITYDYFRLRIQECYYGLDLEG